MISPAPRASIGVIELTSETAEWNDFVRASPDGSPFHLTAWRRAVEAAFRHTAHYLIAKRNGQIEGILPVFENRGLTGKTALISVPYAVYGGICASTGLARDALIDAAGDLARRRGARYIELRQRRDLGLRLPTKRLYFTFSRAISKDPEENARAIPRKQRRMTRQGAKHGLRAEIGRGHFDAFYAIYAQSLRNLGSPVFPRALLRSVFECFGEDSDILSVWQGDRMVAGVLTLYFKDQALPYYGGALREAFEYAVNDFMYWELMCHAARRGYRIFDFGRSRLDTGSYHFKRHWGFEPIPLPYQYVMLRGQHPPNLSPSNPRFGLAVKAWQRLPLAVTNRIGPLLTRYLP